MAQGLMKRVLIGLVALLAVASQAEAQATRAFRVQAVGDDGTALTSGKCVVKDAGLQTDATIYADGQLASTTTNPVTLDTSSGDCVWYMPTTTTSVDVIIGITGGPYQGRIVRVDNVRRDSAKQVVVSRSTGILAYLVTVPASASASSTDTGIVLPAGSMVTHATYQAVTTSASAGIHVGFASGGHGGIASICSAASGSSVGVVDCNPTKFLVSTQSNLAFTNQGHTAGGYAVVYVLPSALNQP